MHTPESRDATKCPAYDEGRMSVCAETPRNGPTTIDGGPVSRIPDAAPTFRTQVVSRRPNMRDRARPGLRTASVPAGYSETVRMDKFADSYGDVMHETATDPAGELLMLPTDEPLTVPDPVWMREIMLAATHNAETLAHAFGTAAPDERHSDAGLTVDVPEARIGPIQEISAQLRQVT